MPDDGNKKKAKEKPDGPVTRRHRKEAKLLLKGVRKFIRYHDDLITDESREKIEERQENFREAVETPGMTWKGLEEQAQDLTETCKKSVKDYKPSALKENIEVIFVAVVIAMGIRAYFAQPFKIPTGSMQPTLNGIIAHPHKDINPNHEYTADYDEDPGFIQRAWEKFWNGRTYVNLVAKEDDTVYIGNLEEKTHFKFFTRTYIPTESGESFSVPGSKSRVYDLIAREVRRNPNVKKGQTIARGFVDTGDQVIVDKFTYHWRRPKRAEVFVFNTKSIDYIQAGLMRENPQYGSQHYIKRLSGTPGDHLQIKPPELWIDGERATEKGFQKVMSQENGYDGYTYYGGGGIHDIRLGPNEFWALGDNTDNSSDSRVFGTVPGEDVVGRAIFVYLPFGNHFGPIR